MSGEEWKVIIVFIVVCLVGLIPAIFEGGKGKHE